MTSRPSIGRTRIGLLNTMFSASSSLTWAAVGLPDSRSLRKGCIVLCSAVPGFDGPNRVFKRLFQNARADGPEHEAEQPSPEVLAFAYDDYVDVGQTIGTTCEGVGVAGGASPRVGVGRREDNVVGIGPVVVQAFLDAPRAFGDVGLRGAPVMHLEVLVGAVAKELRAAGP